MNDVDHEKKVNISLPFVTDESKHDEVILNLDEQPPVLRCSYSCETGSFLHFFRPISQPEETRSLFCYSPWSVASDDDCSLMAWVEVEDDEKEFTLAICGAKECVEGTFLQHFASGQTMRPMGPQEIRRLCICPWHRRALMLEGMDNRIVSCVHLPSEKFCNHRISKFKGTEVNIDDKVNSIDTWRVVVEHKGRGFIRFYAVERSKGQCFCDAPLSFLC